ncbi:MAG: hypothetical protein JXO44_14085 [Clostridia bacterium]|nr:hypothetical protein [Clostridia bacterium]
MNENRERFKYALGNGLVLFIIQSLVLYYFKVKLSTLENIVYLFGYIPVATFTLGVYYRTKFRSFIIRKSGENESKFIRMLMSNKVKCVGVNRYTVKSGYSTVSLTFSVSEYPEFYELRAPEVLKEIIKKQGIADATFS